MTLRKVFSNIFVTKLESKNKLMKRFLIVGLGNVGEKYANTRHNIGFKILDEVAQENKTTFETEKLGDVATFRVKGRIFILLKPSTFMNLSGKALKYWMDKENIS
jgi:PTH1 family peptidyl-tRNA hydrolase